MTSFCADIFSVLSFLNIGKLLSCEETGKLLRHHVKEFIHSRQRTQKDTAVGPAPDAALLSSADNFPFRGT
jgi:hypothetical protein